MGKYEITEESDITTSRISFNGELMVKKQLVIRNTENDEVNFIKISLPIEDPFRNLSNGDKINIAELLEEYKKKSLS